MGRQGKKADAAESSGDERAVGKKERATVAKGCAGKKECFSRNRAIRLHQCYEEGGGQERISEKGCFG